MAGTQRPQTLHDQLKLFRIGATMAMEQYLTCHHLCHHTPCIMRGKDVVLSELDIVTLKFTSTCRYPLQLHYLYHSSADSRVLCNSSRHADQHLHALALPAVGEHCSLKFRACCDQCVCTKRFLCSRNRSNAPELRITTRTSQKNNVSQIAAYDVSAIEASMICGLHPMP